MSTSSSSTASSSATSSSPPPPPATYATSASSRCTTPEPIDEPKPFTVPALDDVRDYTLASLAWQYTRIASALAQLDWTIPAVRAEFEKFASELASRAAKYPNERPHTPYILSKPQEPDMSYIRALARYQMRVAPRRSFAAWKDNEMRMERALEWYRIVARWALALNANLDCSDAASSSSGVTSNPVDLDATPGRGRKRSADEVEVESVSQSAAPSSSGKRKRARHELADDPAPRRSSRRSMAPRRFGAATS
ncbi:hypothetical protein PENSPDRAFT_688271 [Peniophora sp. CONT]|nr:hypothetical protein PENSPDRAFT_688271 [Peniophora sp. CONT]